MHHGGSKRNAESGRNLGIFLNYSRKDLLMDWNGMREIEEAMMAPRVLDSATKGWVGIN